MSTETQTHTRGPVRWYEGYDALGGSEGKVGHWADTKEPARFPTDDPDKLDFHGRCWMPGGGLVNERGDYAVYGGYRNDGEADAVAADEPTGRLLAAAYNSYDKHFGPRAVEAAEADALGEALDRVRASVHFLVGYHMDRCDRADHIEVCPCPIAEEIRVCRALLAKVEGE